MRRPLGPNSSNGAVWLPGDGERWQARLTDDEPPELDTDRAELAPRRRHHAGAREDPPRRRHTAGKEIDGDPVLVVETA
jgi:hypothetical protein